MTSVVADILNSAGVLTKEDIPSKVESLRRKIENIKLEIQESLKSRYVDFVPRYVQLDKLVGSLQEAKEKYDTLHYHVEKEIRPKMSSSVSEYRELYEELKRIQSMKQVVSCLAHMHKCLENARSSLDQKCFLTATENLLQFEEKGKEIGLAKSKDIQIFSAMKTKYFVTKESVIYQLGEDWKKKVSFQLTEKSVKHLSKTELVVNLQQKSDFEDAVQSLQCLGQLETRLRSFGKQLISSVCEHLICSASEMNISDKAGKLVIAITVTETSQPHPETVCDNLDLLFKSLNDSIFHWKVKKNDLQCKETECSLMSILGRCIGDELCEKLIEKSLKPSIPSKSQELKNFQQCIARVMKLQDFFCEIGFLNREDNALVHFVGNVDQLPANKMATELLSHARDLMKHDLHQTVRIGRVESSTPSQVPVTSPTEELQEVSKLKSSGLSKNTFSFPSCQVSVSAKSLVQLLHKVLEEAKELETDSPMYSTKLFYTARSICELYCCVVPAHHKDQITSIPQQTAIFHNNCMYIAHCLLTLGQGHRRVKLPYPVTFIDLVPELRRIGTESFLLQMRTQRQTLLQLLHESGAFQNMAQDENMVNKAERTVRQCLCQLELLKRVWADVLPLEVYFKAIGTLLNTFMEEIILLVTSMEDIAAQVAAQLDSIFGMVLKQSPELFKVEGFDKRDFIHNYVKRWFKFQELQQVLNASLIEIVDRWASGKGPLAAHFTADETKHLIRALFQNTERRAAALGKIR